jgi:hypothetical protein
MVIAIAAAFAAPDPAWAGDHHLVDALGWAADDAQIRRLLRDARSPDGRFADSLQAAARDGRAKHLPLVAAEATLLDDGGSRKMLHVRQAVVYTNTHDTRLDELVLRVIGAGEHEFPGAARVVSLTVDGRPAQSTLDATVLRVHLDEPLRRGDRARVALEMVSELHAFDPERTPYKLKRLNAEAVGVHGFSGGAVHLAGLFAQPTAWLGDGFDRRPLPINGEYAVFDPMNAHLVIDVPDTYEIVTGGVELSRGVSGGRRSVVAVSADTRDLMVALSTDLVPREVDVEGLRLRVYTPTDEALLARQITRWAVAAVETFTAEYGPLSIAELDILEAPLTIAAGAEFSGLVLVDSSPAGSGGSDDVELGLTVAHEVAHQWWSGEVGSDARDEPWVDEALATHGAMLVLEQLEGRPAVQRRLDAQERGLRDGLEVFGLPAMAADLPSEQYDLYRYGAIVYGRGGRFIDAARSAMGAEAFRLAMHDYLKRYRGQRATGDDLLRCLKRRAPDPALIEQLRASILRGPPSPEGP